MFKIDNNSEEFLTRTLITEYSNRFETSRYADDYQGEVEDIIKDFAEVQHKEPCVVKKGGYYGVYHELLPTTTPTSSQSPRPRTRRATSARSAATCMRAKSFPKTIFARFASTALLILSPSHNKKHPAQA